MALTVSRRIKRAHVVLVVDEERGRITNLLRVRQYRRLEYVMSPYYEDLEKVSLSAPKREWSLIARVSLALEPYPLDICDLEERGAVLVPFFEQVENAVVELTSRPREEDVVGFVRVSARGALWLDAYLFAVDEPADPVKPVIGLVRVASPGSGPEDGREFSVWVSRGDIQSALARACFGVLEEKRHRVRLGRTYMSAVTTFAWWLVQNTHARRNAVPGQFEELTSMEALMFKKGIAPGAVENFLDGEC